MLEQVDEPGVEDKPGDRSDYERAEADEDPGAELVEVLDKRRLLAVIEAPWRPELRQTQAQTSWLRVQL